MSDKLVQFAEVQKLAEAFADANDSMMDAVAEMKAEMEAVARKHQRGIKKLTKKVADTLGSLKTCIQENKHLFKSPKTQVFSGVKVGFRKKTGEVVVPDNDLTVELIKKHLPKQSTLLIKTTEKANKPALSNLKGDELKKLGVELKADYNEVVASVVDSSIEKITGVILKSIQADEERDEIPKQPEEKTA